MVPLGSEAALGETVDGNIPRFLLHIIGQGGFGIVDPLWLEWKVLFRIVGRFYEGQIAERFLEWIGKIGNTMGSRVGLSPGNSGLAG